MLEWFQRIDCPDLFIWGALPEDGAKFNFTIVEWRPWTKNFLMDRLHHPASLLGNGSLNDKSDSSPPSERAKCSIYRHTTMSSCASFQHKSQLTGWHSGSDHWQWRRAQSCGRDVTGGVQMADTFQQQSLSKQSCVMNRVRQWAKVTCNRKMLSVAAISRNVLL